MIKNQQLIFIALLAILWGCSDEEPKGESDNIADVLVINEGNFNSGDGSFSIYNTEVEEVSHHVFKNANGYPVGATIQNAVQHSDKIYAVTNAPDKLEVLNAETFESLGYIDEGLSSPYSIAVIGEKAYVTNWGSLNSETWAYENSYIAIVDLNELAVKDSILLDIKPQHVLSHNDYFYVSNGSGSTITVYAASDDKLVKTIEVSAAPDKMVLDAENDLWVICNSANMVKIDTETNEVEDTIEGISVVGFNEKMVINNAGDRLYYLSSSGYPENITAVYELDTESSTAPEEPLISGTNWYGLGIAPDNELYVSDANSFQGNGTVVRYALDGVGLGDFPAGLAPNGFIFMD